MDAIGIGDTSLISFKFGRRLVNLINKSTTISNLLYQYAAMVVNKHLSMIDGAELHIF